MNKLVNRRWVENRRSALYIIVMAVIVGLCFFVFIRVVYADIAEKYRIHLKTRSFIPPVDRSAIPLKINVQTADRVHVITQFNEPLTYSQKQALISSGVVLLDYAPDQAWFASVPRTLDENDPALIPLRWIDTVPASDRVDPDWLATMGGTESVNPDGTVKSAVKFFADVSTSTVYFTVNTLGGFVDSYSPVGDHYIISLPPTSYSTLYELDQVQFVDYHELPAAPDNDKSRSWANTDAAQNIGLKGTGINIGIWDVGMVDTNHPDLADRLTSVDKAWFNPNTNKWIPFAVEAHSTHVAGTAAGNGVNSQKWAGTYLQYRGHAPGANILSFVYGHPVIKSYDAMSQAVDDRGVDIASISMGNYVGWQSNGSAWIWYGKDYPQSLFGKYSDEASAFDKVVYEKGLLQARSAGNHRDDDDYKVGNETTQPPDWDQGLAKNGYDTIQPVSTSKNVMVVGATGGQGMSAFSGWGPTDDGRVKPDVVAHGVSVISTINSVNAFGDKIYGGNSGTSMATPAVAGAAAILMERFYQQYPYVFKQYNGLASFETTAPDEAFGAPKFQAQSFISPVTGRLSKIRINLTVDAGQGWKFTLRNDNGGKPGNVLETWFAGGGQQKWSAVADILMQDHYLKTGTRYWIVGEMLNHIPQTQQRITASPRSGPDKYGEGVFIWSDDGTNWKSETAADQNSNTVENYNPLTSKPDMDIFFELHYKKRPIPSSLKALFINNAVDLGNPGPDYSFGWGLIDTKLAVDAIDRKDLIEDRINDESDPNSIPIGWAPGNFPGSTDEYQISVSSGTPELKVTLAWDDPPPAANAAKTLVNDLDLYLLDPDGNKYFPWTLDPQKPESTATREKADTLNNVEQVYVKNPKAGLWKTVVDGTKLVRFGGLGGGKGQGGGGFYYYRSTQAYSLVGTKLADKNKPIGIIGGKIGTDDPSDPTGAIIPPGASNQDLNGSASPVPQPSPPPEGFLSAGKSYDFGPSGMKFNKNVPVTITLAYDPKFPPGSVDVYYFNPDTNSWDKVTKGKKLDPSKNTVSVDVDHFSIYMPMSSTPPTGANIALILAGAIAMVMSGSYVLGFRKKLLVNS